MSLKNSKRCYRYMKDGTFPVGMWIPPIEPFTHKQDEADRRYAEAAEAGITLAHAIEAFYNFDVLKTCLRAAEKSGIRVMITVPWYDIPKALETVAETKDFPAVMGYTLRDEPPRDSFEQIQKLMEEMRKVVPEDMILMCNALPNYFFKWDAPPDEEGWTDFRKYIRDYIEMIQPDILSVDHYPFGISPANDEISMKCMICDFIDMRNAAAKYNLELWGFLQNSGWTGMREPTAEEIRFHISFHLAFGFKQLSYYLYWVPYDVDLGEGIYTGMITHEGERTPAYDRVKNLNIELRELGTAFFNYEHQAFILKNLLESHASSFDPALVTESYRAIKDIETEDMIMAGCFDKDGKTGLFVMNFKYGAEDTAGAVVKLDGNQRFKVWGKGLEQEGEASEIKVDLLPGGCKFIEIL